MPKPCGGIFDYDSKRERLTLLLKELEDPNLWANPQNAENLNREKKSLENVVIVLENIARAISDGRELFDLGAAENDDETLLAVAADNEKIEKELAALEFRRMFSQPEDAFAAFLEIQSGAGGTEAQDWAAMLLRMYSRFGERRGFAVELLEESEGDVAGIKGATLKFSGEYCFGTLRTETGIHRLVRKSPFDSNAKRHTSFASVFVYPEIDDSIEIEINPADVRIDTFRASGAGGQHIQKTDSAVRITHIPTGITAECQDGRSQHSNKASAMRVLAARLNDKKRQEAFQKRAGLRKSLVGSGDRSERIRTYNFPQGRLTDHRINLTLYRLADIMNGDLKEVVTALANEYQAEQLALLDEKNGLD